MNSPLYRLSAGICLEICWTCSRNLTRSIGATTVFDTAAENPPAMKFFSESYGSDSPDIFLVFTKYHRILWLILYRVYADKQSNEQFSASTPKIAEQVGIYGQIKL